MRYRTCQRIKKGQIRPRMGRLVWYAVSTGLILTADFANKTIEVEPALSPLPQGQSADAQSETPNQTSLDKFKLSYDKLVISVGCYSADFGIPGVNPSG